MSTGHSTTESACDVPSWVCDDVLLSLLCREISREFSLYKKHCLTYILEICKQWPEEERKRKKANKDKKRYERGN